MNKERSVERSYYESISSRRIDIFLFYNFLNCNLLLLLYYVLDNFLNNSYQTLSGLSTNLQRSPTSSSSSTTAAAATRAVWSVFRIILAVHNLLLGFTLHRGALTGHYDVTKE